MKKYLLALVAVMGITTLMAQEATKTLYIVDGVVVSKEIFDSLNPDQIQNVDIFKQIEGAVVVTTKADLNDLSGLHGRMHVVSFDKKTGDQKESKTTTVHFKKQGEAATIEENEEKVLVIGGQASVVTTTKSKTTEVANPLILQKKKDGAIEVLPPDAIKTMDPNTIQAISVVKDKTAEAYATYGEVKNGVIVIELKELPELNIKVKKR
ncbi:MAG: hypothetical protein IIW89_06735 [Alistipes sp.]|nr:hypothetical protein [Alistipes sp.]